MCPCRLRIFYAVIPHPFCLRDRPWQAFTTRIFKSTACGSNSMSASAFCRALCHEWCSSHKPDTNQRKYTAHCPRGWRVHSGDYTSRHEQ